MGHFVGRVTVALDHSGNGYFSHGRYTDTHMHTHTHTECCVFLYFIISSR